jgi:heat-inducible transcriptional repressor
MPLRPGEMLAVMVSRSGVQNRVVRVSRELPPAELERVHNYLGTLVQNRTLAQLRDALVEEMDAQRDDYTELRRHAKEMVEGAVGSTDMRAEIVIEGQGVLFDRPEFSSAEKIRAFLRAFEERETLLELLDRTLVSGGFQVLIGPETQLSDVDDISVISANYRHSGTTAGTVGVIGPTRMDYGRVVPLVGFTAHMMTEMFDGEPSDDDR